MYCLDYIRKENLKSNRKEITLREAMLRKYKADLKQKKAACKKQQKFCVNQKGKIQAINEKTRAKLPKKLQGQEKVVDNEELAAAIYRISISGSSAHKRRRSEIVQTDKTLDELIEALNKEGYNLKRS